MVCNLAMACRPKERRPAFEALVLCNATPGWTDKRNRLMITVSATSVSNRLLDVCPSLGLPPRLQDDVSDKVSFRIPILSESKPRLDEDGRENRVHAGVECLESCHHATCQKAHSHVVKYVPCAHDCVMQRLAQEPPSLMIAGECAPNQSQAGHACGLQIGTDHRQAKLEEGSR